MWTIRRPARVLFVYGRGNFDVCFRVHTIDGLTTNNLVHLLCHRPWTKTHNSLAQAFSILFEYKGVRKSIKEFILQHRVQRTELCVAVLLFG